MTPDLAPTLVPIPPERREVRDVTCLGCGCLCDDIDVSVDGNRIVEARHACEIGRTWFLADHAQDDLPLAAIDGHPTDPALALDRAAEILAGSRRPLILGLSRATIETQAAAVALADSIGAAISPGDERERMAELRAFQRVGAVSATLGEVKNRADVVVFWGADPVVTHPRHFERYSVDPIGRFAHDGRRGRTVIVVDSRGTETANRADRSFVIEQEAWFESLATLRALVRGVRLDSSHRRLVELADLLRSARYGAFFHGPFPDAPTAEAASRLICDLNEGRRFVGLPMGGPGNQAGASAVLGWQTGYAEGLDFTRGYPRSLLGDGSAEVLLAGREADVALIVSDQPPSFLGAAALDHLGHIPTIHIAPEATESGRTVAVALRSSTPGIHAGGNILRCDGVMLPIRPTLTSVCPTDRQYLEAISDRLRRRSSPSET